MGKNEINFYCIFIAVCDRNDSALDTPLMNNNESVEYLARFYFLSMQVFICILIDQNDNSFLTGI